MSVRLDDKAVVIFPKRRMMRFLIFQPFFYSRVSEIPQILFKFERGTACKNIESQSYLEPPGVRCCPRAIEI